MRTRDVSLAAVYAALYAVLTVGLGPFSYLAIQVRISDAMVGLVPLLGWPAVIGHTIGVAVSNSFSPAGFLDLLNTIPSFVMAYVVMKLKGGNVRVITGLLSYTVVLSATVSWMLSYLYGLPPLETYVYVFIGIFISTVLIGFALYKTIGHLKFFGKGV